MAWLLEEDNPGVRLRTLRALCGYSETSKEVQKARKRVVDSLEAARDLKWTSLKFCQKLIYNLTALAESGLTYRDINLDQAADHALSSVFDCCCGDFMAMRALIMLGYKNDSQIKQRLAQMKEAQLPDGGWLCFHRIKKMKRIPKSCMRAAMHGLLFISELQKKGISYEGADQLAGYFLKRRLFFRTDDPKQLVLSRRPGRRMTDIFFPSELFYVGLPLLLESLSALGAGQAKALDYAWSLLDEKRDDSGRMILEGTMPLNRAYLPKEKVGKPSKWATFYAYAAWKNGAVDRRNKLRLALKTGIASFR